MEKKLYKDEQHKMIGGVCAGLAEYFNIDVTIIRVLFFATLILKGGGLLLYIILWVCLPKKPLAFFNPTVDYTVPPFGTVPPQPGDPFIVQPKRQSKGGIVIGAILIVVGAFLLLDEFDIIPDWDFENLWPVILVLIGGALIFSGSQKKPWDNANWQQTNATAKKEEETTNDNSTAI